MSDIPPIIQCPGYQVPGGHIPCGAYLSVAEERCVTCGTFFAPGVLWSLYEKV